MDTGDVKFLERVLNLEARVGALEGWRTSLKNDLENVAKHSLEVDKKCSEIEIYLQERKEQRALARTLLIDVRKWAAVIVVGWLVFTFLDGARFGVLEWLQKKPVSGQQDR